MNRKNLKKYTENYIEKSQQTCGTNKISLKICTSTQSKKAQNLYMNFSNIQTSPLASPNFSPEQVYAIATPALRDVFGKNAVYGRVRSSDFWAEINQPNKPTSRLMDLGIET